MKKSFDFISDLTDLAKERKIKLVNVSVSDRRNKRGEYDFIEVSFLSPKDEETPVKKFDLEAEIAELEAELDTDEESEKEEVNSNEI